MIQQFGAGPENAGLQSRTWDLCIVGAGAVGLALAAEFLETGQQVIVLESGLHEPDRVGDDRNTLDCVGLPHEGWRDGRVRALGGTTRAWGGQLVPMRKSELAERAWVAGSGWPLELSELQPFYRRVERLLRIQGPPYDDAVWSQLSLERPQFDVEQFCIRFSQWAALGRRNFALLWRKRLEASNNVTVLLDATAVAVRSTPAGNHCDHVAILSRNGRKGEVRATRFVIACGGIETPRLLLASGIANSSGTVGRYFQDHVSYIAGQVQPTRRRLVQDIFDPRYRGGTMFSVKVEPSDAAMSCHGWLNAMAHIAFQIPDALGWMEVRRLLRSLQAGRVEWPSGAECLAMLRGGVELAQLALARAVTNRRRSPDSGGILMLVDCEQAPNPDSRISLDTAVDALGMRKARLDWRLTDLEYTTLTGFARQAAAELERLGIGRVRLAEQPDFGCRDVLGAARDIFHHMGTARMSAGAAAGVTRPDLRCHDVDNLYIAGPAVFPTSGIANPTFTALALTLRLADHLKRAVTP